MLMWWNWAEVVYPVKGLCPQDLKDSPRSHIKGEHNVSSVTKLVSPEARAHFLLSYLALSSQ